MIRYKHEFNGKVIIEEGCIIGANVTIAVGTEGVTRIGRNSLVMNNALIGHNVSIGKECEIGGGVNIAGHAVLEDKVVLKTGVTVRNRVKIRKGITIGQGSNVVNDIGADGGTVYVGNPCDRILK
jgi:UDP-3-O-[3-hydroxymyristoyl] glucosamine N-acyltransferase